MSNENPSENDSDRDEKYGINESMISEEDLTAERLTEIFRHKRVVQVDETSDGFEFIFRSGNTITVDPSATGEIWGLTKNKYMREVVRGADDTGGLVSAESVLERGDLVRLKDPLDSSTSYVEYTHGIVVELRSRFGDDFGHAPRQVSLHLYDPQTHEMYFDTHDRYGSPKFVDRHIRNLVLVQKANDDFYRTRDIDIAEYIGLEEQR